MATMENESLEELNRRVIRGEADGRIIWQPRIGCWYQDKKFAGETLPQPFTGMDLPEIYSELGCSARLYDFNGCFRRVDDPRVRAFSEKLSERETRHVVETPVGTMTSVTQKTPSSWAEITTKRWITSKEDMEVAAWREEHCDWEWDETHYRKTQKKWGNMGLPTIFMPRVNIQHLYIDVMGVEAATYALVDYPDTVERYFAILEESRDRLIAVINDSPIEVINFGDNLHAGTLSPRLFEEYVLPVYQRRSEKLHAAGKFVHAHWDGDTKSLLPYARDTGLDGIEAITPKPQGDVTLQEVKEALGDEMYLIDGIPAVLFDETFTEQELRDTTWRVIERFAPRLILGISDEISSTGDIERVRLVGEIVEEYNASVVCE